MRIGTCLLGRFSDEEVNSKNLLTDFNHLEGDIDYQTIEKSVIQLSNVEYHMLGTMTVTSQCR